MPPRLMRGFANRGRFRQMLQRVVRDETLVYTGQCLHESLQDALQLRNDAGKFLHRPSTIQFLDVLQLSGLLAGDVKQSRNDNPTGDLQMAADRTRHHPLCGPVVSSLFSLAARC